jgi:hypothetical protein
MFMKFFHKPLKYTKINACKIDVFTSTVPLMNKIIHASVSYLTAYLVCNNKHIINFYVYEDGSIFYKIINANYNVSQHEVTNKFKQWMFKIITSNKINCCKKLYSVIKNSKNEVIATISYNILKQKMKLRCLDKYYWEESPS